MVKIWYRLNKFVCFDGTDKEFMSKYGPGYEQLEFVKDSDNVNAALSRLSRSLKGEVVRDYKVKKKFGWKYYDDNMRERIRLAISKAHKGKPKSELWKKKRSELMKGRSLFEGRKHSDDSKKLISISRGDRDPIMGKRWCYNPATGKELRCYELPEGFVWGRDPSIKDYFTKYK